MARCNSRFFVFAMTVVLAHTAGCEKPPSSPGGPAVDTKAAGSASPTATEAKPSAAPAPGSLLTAQNVLEKMAAAYKNAPGYEDFGSLEFRQDPTREQSETRVNFSVAFQRPNKLRIELFSGRVICDGKRWCATCQAMPRQAVLREAPAKLDLEILRADYLQYSSLSDGEQLVSPQLQLLWDKDPIPSLVAGSQEVTLEEPGRLGDYQCYRVRVALPAGPEYLWIDQKTFALRMMVVPVATPRPSEGQGQPDRMWIVMNFERARLGGDIDPKAFQFEIGEGVKKTRALVQTGPYELVGRKAPEFKFVDLQGKPWSSQSLAGKAAVIHFWRSDAVEAQSMTTNIEQLYEKFKADGRVAVVAVSLDNPDTPSKAIEDAGKQLKLTMPLLRDNGTEAGERLKIIGPPTTLFIDAKGVLQDCLLGVNPLTAAGTPRKLEQLLAGEDLARRSLAEFQQQAKDYEKRIDMQFSGEAQSDTVHVQPTAMATRSGPAKLRLKSLWKCVAVHSAGNVLVTHDPGGPPRIYVIDGYKSVSEIGIDGRQLGNYRPKIAEREFFICLRSGAGRDGKRYFVAFAPTGQRFHLFDEKFNYLRSYPSDVLDNPHAGLGDVALGDLDGDGVLKAYVGFAGVVGVQCVSLQGTMNWGCRNLFNVGGVVPGPTNSRGQSELYCVNDATSVASLDAKGQLRDATRLIAEGVLRSFMQADLAGNGRPTWCGVMFVPDPQLTSGKFTALGMDSNFQVQWKYALPAGTQQAVESIIVGRLLPGTARQWILPGSDGSIHVLAADGTLIDRFNYGEQVSGVATVEIDGKPALLISSANGVEALRVE